MNTLLLLQRPSGALLWLIFGLAGTGYGQTEIPRGVPLARKNLYDPSKDFACLDGSKTIPFKYVNDDYCDCTDGSDEPGTAACPSGYFHCVNVGHAPMNIPSSRVNDGICDCCDGSDEWDGAVTCPNMCDEIGRAARAEADRQAEAQRDGFAKRLELSKQSQALKADKQKRLEELRKEKDDLDPRKDELNMAKQSAEAAETEAKDRHTAAWNEAKEQRKKARAAEAFKMLDLDGDGTLTAEELTGRPEFDKDGDGTVSLDEGKYYLMAKESVTEQEFVDDIWNGIRSTYRKPGSEDDGDATANTQPPPPPPTQGERIEDAPPAPPSPPSVDGDDEYREDDGDDDDEGENDEVEDFDSDKYLKEGEEAPPPPPADVDSEDDNEPEPEHDEATKAVIEAANEARRLYQEVEDKFRDIEGEIKIAESFLETDYGPDDAFAPLKGECTELTDSQYTYKFCAFDRCTQRDKNHGGETSLGSWGSWHGPENDDKYSVMLFNKGQSCWNGPERSTIVRLKCRVDTRLVSATEPGKCEYEFVVETPAACTDPALASGDGQHAGDEL